MTVHNFARSLKMSKSYGDAPWWGQVYRQAFPTMQAMVDVRSDGWAQRGGIDRQIVLADGTVIKIDEKVRSKDYPDFFLEAWSDRDRQVKGWAAKDLTCDFIAYAFVPSRTCYLLPFQLLRRAIDKHHGRWWREYLREPVENEQGGRSWVTVGVAVPIDEVLCAITECMVIRWQVAA